MMHQSQYLKLRKKKKIKNRIKRLERCPQKKARCWKLAKLSPKKPNSARRQVAYIEILSTEKFARAYIPGENQLDVKAHSRILIRGGRVRDLPGMRFKAIRGKFDLKYLVSRKTSRSKYGTPQTKDLDKEE